MRTPLELTPAQMAAEAARIRDGRPDIAAMSNEERREAGLMDRHQAAEHEHLTVLPHPRLAERVRGPVPAGIWDSEGARIWQAWAAAGPPGMGCEGWSQDSRDDRVVCSCGEVVPLEGLAS